MSLVVKDAFWQILGRIASAVGGFLVIKLMTPYLGPIRYGDYSTILKYFAIRSALADFGVYVIALRELGKIRKLYEKVNHGQVSVIGNNHTNNNLKELSDNGEPKTENQLDPSRGKAELNSYYSKFVSSRLFMIFAIYSLALLIAYLIPAYTANPYLVRGLPFGMLFSASFMVAGILQLPLQLFWKMEQVSIGLIIARIVQIAVLALGIFIIYPYADFSNNGAIQPFLIILVSVVASGISQGAYVYRAGRKHLTLSRTRDRSFTKSIIKDNRQYGIAYYLSSFHTLIVLILLSVFYPTIQNYNFVGIRALALSLLEIMLIVPSSLGNSLIHKLSHHSIEQKLASFGALLSIVVWIASIATLNFYWFATPLIQFLGGSNFLATVSHIGSDTILPYLGVVLILSFMKQVCNYVFVATHMQNKLLWSNLFGVVIGLMIGVPLIASYHLWGAIATQVILEIGFVASAGWIAYQHKLIPHINRRFFSYLGITFLIGGTLKYFYGTIPHNFRRIIYALVLNSIVLLCRWKELKVIGRSL